MLSRGVNKFQTGQDLERHDQVAMYIDRRVPEVGAGRRTF
jgi:hypothetical protein